MLEVCKYMGWDFYTYFDQPEEFISLILARMEGEALAKKILSEKNGATIWITIINQP